jgi:NAD(P)-dependent dehydrogenase (short-subunit alcohol dehydrogenase family)
MADALAAAGAAVAVVGRSEERGRERVRAIEKAGGKAIFVAADAMNPDSLAAARDAITAQLGNVTVLINGAGGNKPEGTVAPGGDFCKMGLDGWNAVFDLNLVGGTLLPCQIFGAKMVEAGKGSIINVASMASITPLSRVVAYSASKAAVLNLTLWLAREWARKGRTSQRDQPRVLPGRAEPADAAEGRRHVHRARRGDRGSHSDGPVRHRGGAGRGDGVASVARASGFVTGQNIVWTAGSRPSQSDGAAPDRGLPARFRRTRRARRGSARSDTPGRRGGGLEARGPAPYVCTVSDAGRTAWKSRPMRSMYCVSSSSTRPGVSAATTNPMWFRIVRR